MLHTRRLFQQSSSEKSLHIDSFLLSLFSPSVHQSSPNSYRVLSEDVPEHESIPHWYGHARPPPFYTDPSADQLPAQAMEARNNPHAARKVDMVYTNAATFNAPMGIVKTDNVKKEESRWWDWTPPQAEPYGPGAISQDEWKKTNESSYRTAFHMGGELGPYAKKNTRYSANPNHLRTVGIGNVNESEMITPVESTFSSSSAYNWIETRRSRQSGTDVGGESILRTTIQQSKSEQLSTTWSSMFFWVLRIIPSLDDALFSSDTAPSWLQRPSLPASQSNAPNSRPRLKLNVQPACGISSIRMRISVAHKQAIRSSTVAHYLKFNVQTIRIKYGKVLRMPMIINPIHQCSNLRCTNKSILIDANKSFSNSSDVSSCLLEKHFTWGDQTYPIPSSSSSSFLLPPSTDHFFKTKYTPRIKSNRHRHLALRCRLFDGSAAIVCVEDLVRSTDRQSHLRIRECAVRTAMSRWNEGFICSVAPSVESLDHGTYRSRVSFRFACQSHQVIEQEKKLAVRSPWSPLDVKERNWKKHRIRNEVIG